MEITTEKSTAILVLLVVYFIFVVLKILQIKYCKKKGFPFACGLWMTGSKLEWILILLSPLLILGCILIILFVLRV